MRKKTEILNCMKTTISVNALFRSGELAGFKKAMNIVETMRNEKEDRDRQCD